MIAYEGGGAYLNSGTETFTQADISSNRATESGAGLFIFVEDINAPTTITASTISQNVVGGIVGVTSILGDGGGILADGCNQIDLTNDTIAGNTANELGGGYFGTRCGFNALVKPSAGPEAPPAATPHIAEQPVTNFVFDTVDANTAGQGGGNINTDDSSNLDGSETIIADGVSNGVEGTNCTFTGGGTFTSLGYNLIDDTTCGTPGTGDIIGQGAQLGALGNNGGPTNTELPASTSPAVGARAGGCVHRDRRDDGPARQRPWCGPRWLVHDRRGRGGGGGTAGVQPQRLPAGGATRAGSSTSG